MKRKISFAVSGLCAAVAGALAANVVAGPEKIAFPAGYNKWEMYANIDRPDLKQYRELYGTPEAVKAAREGKSIPQGTVLVQAAYAAKLDDKGVPVRDANGRFIKEKLAAITVMEKRQGWGAEYPEQKRNGEWEYAAFAADGKPNEKANANIDACFNCHKPHEKQDFVISLAQLAGKFPTGPVAMKSGANDVNITSFSFGPSTIKVTAGQAVTWTNADSLPHQISVAGKALKTAVLLRGQSASLKFDEAGTFGYICSLHPNLKGTVEVTK